MIKKPDEYIVVFAEKNGEYFNDNQISKLFKKIYTPKSALLWAQKIKTNIDICYEICKTEREDQELIFEIAKFFNRDLDFFISILKDEYLKMKLIYASQGQNQCST